MAFMQRRGQSMATMARLECGNWSPLARADLLSHKAACRPGSSGRLGAGLRFVLRNSRQQAAWPSQRDDLQSGDRSPHSKRDCAVMGPAIPIPLGELFVCTFATD